MENSTTIEDTNTTEQTEPGTLDSGTVSTDTTPPPSDTTTSDYSEVVEQLSLLNDKVEDLNEYMVFLVDVGGNILAYTQLIIPFLFAILFIYGTFRMFLYRS